MKRWLTIATGCNCDTLDVCGLFEDEQPLRDQPTAPADATALELTHHG